jgi:hypothetical protein
MTITTDFEDLSPVDIYDQKVSAAVVEDIAHSVNHLKALATGTDHTGTPSPGHDHDPATAGTGPRIPIAPAGFIGVIPVPWVMGQDPDNPVSAAYHQIPVVPNFGDETSSAGVNRIWQSDTLVTDDSTAYGIVGLSGNLGVVNGAEPIHWLTSPGDEERFLCMPTQFLIGSSTYIPLVYTNATPGGTCYVHSVGSNSVQTNYYAREFNFPLYPRSRVVRARLNCIATVESYIERDQSPSSYKYYETKDAPLSVGLDTWLFKLYLYNETESVAGEPTYIYPSASRTTWGDSGRFSATVLEIDVDPAWTLGNNLWSIRQEVNLTHPAVGNYAYDRTDGANADGIGLDNCMLWFHNPELEPDGSQKAPSPMLWMECGF